MRALLKSYAGEVKTYHREFPHQDAPVTCLHHTNSAEQINASNNANLSPIVVT